MDTLFLMPETPSPRLQWIDKHKIMLIDNGRTFTADDESPETGERLYRFCAHQGDKLFGLHPATSTGWGDTEDDAIVDLAKKLNLRLWNE